MTDQEIDNWKQKIDEMSHKQLASLYRFSPSGHPVFDKRFPIYDYFEQRFKQLRGMTTEISKQIGW